MKKTTTFILLLTILLFLVSCKTTILTTENTTVENTTSNNFSNYELKVSFVYDGITVSEQTYPRSSKFEEISYSIPGKVFRGYYEDLSYTKKIDVETYIVTKSQTVYLKFENFKYFNVLYIPLDNRPVNKERVILLSKSVNINLIMPNEDLYRTYLDDQLLNENGTKIGDPKKLLEFIKSQNRDSIDAFIISLDQMTSGGLVGSRANYDSNIKDELDIIEDLIKYVGDKPLYLIDTVMRLASTVGFDNYDLNTYNGLRNYARVPRYPITFDDLSLETIKKSYNKDLSNQEIPLTGSSSGGNYVITEEKRDNYLTARYRKMELTSNIINLMNKKNTYYICGIDDSSMGLNIQSNEVNYIKKILPLVNLFPGTDELGLMCLSKFYQEQVNLKSLTAKITYFGTTYHLPDNNYDGISLNNNIKNHLTSLGVKTTTENKFDFEILVLTSDSSSVVTKKSADLQKHLQKNIDNDIVTCVIDANSLSSSLRKILPKELLKTTNLSKILGYSSWNTVGNSVGISLAMATSRLSYLKTDYSTFATDIDQGFVNSLTFALIKDITYKAGVSDTVAKYINTNAKDKNGNVISTANSNFYKYIPYSPDFNLELTHQMSTVENFNSNIIIQKLENGQFYSSLKSTLVRVGKIEDINVSNFNFPWYRHFEITFNVSSTITY